jgi:hypothetical protein
MIPFNEVRELEFEGVPCSVPPGVTYNPTGRLAELVKYVTAVPL